MKTTLSARSKAISWDTEVLARASEGHGSLDDQPDVIRYPAMRIARYDIVLSCPFRNYDFFAHRMRELCGQMGLTLFIVDDVWVREFLQKLQSEEIQVRVLFDLSANQSLSEDPYLLLAREVKRQGGYVIDNPDKTAIMAHKGQFHKMLLENNIPVPETVIVSRSDVDRFKITNEIKAQVGVPFVVKPAWGDSAVGVTIDGYSEKDLRWSAEQAPNSDSFLIQQRLKPKQLEGRSGWFRMFHICGEVIPGWWNPINHEYHLVTPTQQRYYKLAPLKSIMRSIAQVSKMKKFTSEICLHEDGKFYSVDYMNADPDMNPRSFYPNGVPDEVVRHIAWLLFYEGMHIVKRGQGFFDADLVESEGDWLEQRRLEQRVQS